MKRSHLYSIQSRTGHTAHVLSFQNLNPRVFKTTPTKMTAYLMKLSMVNHCGLEQFLINVLVIGYFSLLFLATS